MVEVIYFSVVQRFLSGGSIFITCRIVRVA
jgi:hypothetical protein